MSILQRCWNAMRPRHLNNEIRQELETHFALIEEEEQAHGLSADDARVRARLRFGNQGVYRDRTREANIAHCLDSVWQDFRFAFRQLLHNPGFSASAVLLLALGIGLNAAIFTIIDSVVLRSLPLSEPDRLVVFLERTTGGFETPPSWPDQRDIREGNHVFQSVAGFSRDSNFILRLGDRTRSIKGGYVTPDYFATLGVQPIMGRVFDSSEARVGQNSVVLLREDFWQTAFGGDPAILQKTIVLNGRACNVVGILPSKFRFPSGDGVVWTPLVPQGRETDRGWHSFSMVGRLKPGVSLHQAQADLELIMHRLAREYPEKNAGRSALLVRLQDWSIDTGIRRRLFILQIAALMLFLMTCANVSGLLLARYSSRRLEFAIRTALGASRLRQIRQHVTESLLLTGLGCLAAIAVAWAGVRFLLWLYAGQLPRASEISPDWQLVAIVVALALAAAVAIGLATALHETGKELEISIQESNRATGARRSVFARRILVTFQVACAVALLGAAGEVLQSFWTLLHVDVGLDRNQLLTMRVELPPTKYKTGPEIGNFFDDAAARVQALPGVTAAAAINLLPVAEFGFNGDVNVEGLPNHHRGFFAEYRWITQDYFRTMHIPLMRGRLFFPREMSGKQNAAIINETMARALWGAKDPLGAHIRFFSPEWITVVGVVRDVRQSGVDVPSSPEVYLPAVGYAAPFPSWSLAVRSSVSAESLVAEIRHTMRIEEQDAVVDRVKTMDDVVAESVSYQRIVASLLLCFSILALSLATLGVYSVVAYLVVARTPELALRAALGCSPAALIRLVARQALALIGIGAVFGLIAMVPVNSLLTSALYGVHRISFPVFGLVLAVLIAAGTAAILIPARRTIGIEPLQALRRE